MRDFSMKFDLNYGRVVLLDVPNREESAKRNEEEDGGKREEEREQKKRESEREKQRDMTQTKEK